MQVPGMEQSVLLADAPSLQLPLLLLCETRPPVVHAGLELPDPLVFTAQIWACKCVPLSVKAYEVLGIKHRAS